MQNSITTNELKTLMQNADFAKTNLIIDVRTAEEHSAGCIPGAINICLDELPYQLGVFDEYSNGGVNTFFIHCKSGGRSMRACEFLSSQNITNAVNVEGGYEAWQK